MATPTQSETPETEGKRVIQFTGCLTVSDQAYGELRKQYRAAGAPCGDSDDGLERWLGSLVHERAVDLFRKRLGK
jgi:hypothetical protein